MVKVKLIYSLPWRKRRGVKVNNSTLSLTSALDGVCCACHTQAALTPGIIMWVGGWLGPRADPEWSEKFRTNHVSIPGASSP